MTEPRTFDASSAQGPYQPVPYQPETPPADPNYGAAALAMPRPEEPEVSDTLGLLRARVAERTALKPTVVEVPGGTIRLTCSVNVDSKDIQRWNRKALGPVARKSANPTGLDVDPAVLHTAVLVGTTEYIEVLGTGGQWKTITDTEGNELTFKDAELLNAFGALDSGTAVRNLFGRDSDIVKAGTQVLTRAGWAEGATGEESDDDSDPTER